ncbi:MAG: hypothetical protein KBT14_03045 [Proteobacteria bacterium]|nr:hypothetical protein [Candidatus Enterousia onthequi]
MRRIGIILVFCTILATGGFAASRVQNTSPTTRAGTTTQRVKTQSLATRPATRVATQKATSRTAKNITTNVNRTISNRQNTTSARAGVVARTTTDTQIGAEYEQCKTAYFACMDQFCQLKNDDYRRCSCSDRITSLQSARDNLVQAGEQLMAFNENLDIVGKTAAQATAMNTASQGELALSGDKSASSALLSAIMDSIRGTSPRVENNLLSSLNSVNMSFDTANSFGTSSVGQTIAAYNGQALYSAVYPQCRDAVSTSCNTASLQRAVNAYLMAIEQDCNTVQTAINAKQKETHAAIRESSAMLDMARAENHQKHNSDNIATCLANVESAILSEEVCGANYHKCLDNGEYINVATGAPIAGVIDFYKLGTMLSFTSGRSNADQKLAQNPNNRTFVTNFEKRVKQFAEPALDKCYDDANTVWTDYLNKALLDIYYAQQSKVDEIKQGCFDFVSACYMNGSTAMTEAMQGLVAAQTTVLKPNNLNLNRSLCSDYIASCNNMFDGNIVKDYINHRHDTDSQTACRAVVQQCFDNYGGQNYENFYNPSSGLFASGEAPKWFALYEYDSNGNQVPGYASECAKQLAEIDACKDNIEQVFGGFDYYAIKEDIFQRYKFNNQPRVLRPSGIATEVYNQIIDILQTNCTNLDGKFMTIQNLALDEYKNSYSETNFCQETFNKSGSRYYGLYKAYSIGKTANKVIIKQQLASTTTQINSQVSTIVKQNMLQPKKHISENMCPRDYETQIDVQSWGACLCWEKGGRRSNDGTSKRCSTSFPVRPLSHHEETTTTTVSGNTSSYASTPQTVHGLNHSCNTKFITRVTTDNNGNQTAIEGSFDIWSYEILSTADIPTNQDWCTVPTTSINNKNQVCPLGTSVDQTTGKCQECPADWTQNGTTCTLQNCPTGYTFGTVDNVNVCYPTNNFNKPTCCPYGSTYDSQTNKCKGGPLSQSSPCVKLPIPTEVSSELMKKFPEG